jgi:hypothetical protein
VLEKKIETLGEDNESTCATKLNLAKLAQSHDLEGAVEYLCANTTFWLACMAYFVYTSCRLLL